MEFRVLGPLEVSNGSRRLDLGTPKQRAVLSLLLSEPNRVVSQDRLLMTLWGDDLPATAAGTLQGYISVLRRALEPERAPRAPAKVLVTRAPGYLVAVETTSLDSTHFEALADEGGSAIERDPGWARDRLREALSLWRGDPFCELADNPAIAVSVTRLEELRRTAVEDLLAARIALGEHLAVIADLERAVVDQPLRERGWELLVVALYRSGRQADALRAVSRVREILAEEVGLQPGPRLIELERRVLDQDPSLELPSTVSVRRTDDSEPAAVAPAVAPTEQSVLRSAEPGFVGRRAPLERLEAILTRTRQGRGALVLVTGEAGIGKTSLVHAATSSVRDEADENSPVICWGRSPEGEGAPAYWPWAATIDALALEHEDLPVNGALLGHLVPHLAEVLGPPPTLPDEPAAARFALHQAVIDLLRVRATRRARVIVLDDIHWSDASSLRLLQAVATDLGSMGVVVIATYRPTETTANPELHDVLGAIAREQNVERIQLEGLEAEEIADLLAAIPEAPDDPQSAQRLQDRTGGNPFFLVELLRLLLSEGRLGDLSTEVDRSDLGVPRAVQDVVLRRLARLPDATREALTLAAVAGRDVHLEMLDVAIGLAGDEVLDLLDPAIAASLLLQVPGLFGTFRFSHAVVRDALYQSIGPAQRARLHKRVGDAIAAVNAADSSRQLGELAHHYSIAMPLGTAATALTWARLAAEQATAQLADDQAAQFWEMAIAAHQRVAPDDLEQRLDLFLSLANARRRSWDLTGATTAVDRAVDIAVTLDDPRRTAEALSVFGRLSLWNWREYGEVDHRSIQLLEQSLERLAGGDDPVRAAALGTLAVELYYDPDSAATGTGVAAGRSAVEMARRIGDPQLLARTLNNLFISMWRPAHAAEQLAITDEMLAIADATPEVQGTALLHRAGLLLRAGRFEQFNAELPRRREVQHRVKGPELTSQFAVQDATLAYIAGRFGDAMRISEQAWSSRLRSTSTWGAEWVLMLQRFLLVRESGNVSDVATAAVELAHRPTLEMARPTAILALLESDRREEAIALAAQWPVELPDDWAFDVSLAHWAEVAVELETPDREQLLRIAEDQGNLFIIAGTLVAAIGPVQLVIGRLKASLGDLDGGIAHVQEAVDQARAVGAPAIEARASMFLAEMLVRRGNPASLSRAAELTEVALRQCTSIGLPVLARRIRTATG